MNILIKKNNSYTINSELMLFIFVIVKNAIAFFVLFLLIKILLYFEVAFLFTYRYCGTSLDDYLKIST